MKVHLITLKNYFSVFPVNRKILPFGLFLPISVFAKKKSLEMVHGTIGFRTGTPKLKTLKGFTWASAKNLVCEFLPAFIRTTEEIAKDKLLADRDVEGMTEKMAQCGIMVAQDETFYVEPKKEDA